MTSLYEFTAKSLRGDDVALDVVRGKVALVVNTASKCGFTPQYEGLQALHREFGPAGLEILAFPCNQFGGQEPGTSEEIARFCQRHYGVSFRMFGKIDVNGPHAHPLYRWLTGEVRGFLGTRRIKWNFTKFLIDREGRPVARFASMTPPAKLAGPISRLL
ncbi:MAG TPA: glutathione peroxidase [Burkholderiales bacterium]|nr:glutathione peroxidase [Burkholderiales bacterium]